MSESLRPRRLADVRLVSVLVPCYNEAEVMEQLAARLTRAAEAWNVPWEVILVDDGSTDRTWELTTALHARDPRFKGIALSRNFGHQTALWTALHAAAGDLVVVLDADLQDPPEELPRLFAKWEEGFDVVYAVRRNRKEGLLLRAAYTLFYRVLHALAETKIPLDAGDFCVMDRVVVDELRRMPESERFVRGLRSWVGFRQIGVEYDRAERAAGAPKYTVKKLVGLALDGLLSFSTVPLRLATWFGLSVSLLAFLGAVFTVLQRIFAVQFARVGLAPVPGFATIVVSVLFLGGIQLLCLGIVGEYLARIYENVKGRPPWVIRATAGIDAPQPGAPPR
jgi:dolichol-phosphate mannosyltransferase